MYQSWTYCFYSLYLVYVSRKLVTTIRLIGNKDAYLILMVFLIFLNIVTRYCYLFVYSLGRPSHCAGATMELLTGFFLSTTLYLNLGVFINFIGASHFLSMGGPIKKYQKFRKRLSIMLFIITWINFVILVCMNIHTCSSADPK